MRFKSFDTPARVRVLSRVLQMHNPIFTLAFVPVDIPAGEINADAPVQTMVVHEETLNDFTMIAQRDAKLLEAEVRIMLEDMPENRLTTDLDHWLWLYLCLFSEART